MNNPLISVIVPIYKVEQYLDECVESLIKQTYSNLEIILVDDGSPDRCPQMCDDWAKKDTRIKVVHKPNGGLSDARNVGMEVAQGDYIGFVDSDDFVECHMYERLLEGFSFGDDIAVSSIKVFKYIEGKTSVFENKWDIKESRKIEGNEFAENMISSKCCYTAWNKLYKHDIVRNVRFRKGRNNEDTLFMFDLGKVMKQSMCAMMEMPYTCYYYRMRPDSICTTAKKPLELDVIQNLEDMMQECGTDDKKLHETLYRVYISRLYGFCDQMLLNPIHKKQYFKTYQAKLNAIPKEDYKSLYSLNDRLYISMIINCPSVRTLIRKAIEKRYIPSLKTVMGG